MRKQEWYGIINGRISLRKRQSIQRLLQQNDIDSATTKYSGHVGEILQQAGTFQGIISIGGDGTLHEVINGINLEKQKTLVIPAGTINCFARFVGIRRVKDGIKLMDEGELQKVDLLQLDIHRQDGCREKQYVWGFLTFGRLVRITTLASRFSVLPKFMRYFLSTIFNHAICSKTNVTISVNGQPAVVRKFSSFILNNATSGHFSSIPSWDMQDGSAEMQMVNHNPITQFIASFSRFIKLPVNLSWINAVQFLTCEFDKPVRMMADGEIISGIRKLDVVVIPGCCKMVLPPGTEMKYRIPGFRGNWKQFH